MTRDHFRAAAAIAFTVVAAPATLSSRAAQAETRVSPLVGDHMVVQQGAPVRLSGTDVAGQEVRATMGAAHASARADAGGRWTLALPAVRAGGPYTLTVEGSSAASFNDVWGGEVWLASGQSNMELPLTRSSGAAEATAGGCPGLRFFLVTPRTAGAPVAEVAGKWQPCAPATAAGFSAAAFHFARELHRALGVPVGIIQAAWGGTPAEAWTPREALVADPVCKPLVDALDQAVRDPGRRAELARRLAEWEAKNFNQDPGNRGAARGFARGKTAAGGGWSPMEIPQPWENAGLKIDGAVWFRREVTLPAEWAGADLALSLGAIDDFDVTYWNGEKVGATGGETPMYWSAPRRYVIPGRLARAGRNLIAVRVFDHYGNGGLMATPAELSVAPAHPEALAAGGANPVPLAGTWMYRVERRLPPAVADFSKRPVTPGPDEPTSPTVLWNGEIAPLAGWPIAGVIWYQGESNVGRATQYRALFTAMIRAWRSAWQVPALPFLFVQLPNFEPPAVDGPAHSSQPKPMLGESAWAELREAQAQALREPRTAMVVALDIGESGDIHPRNKREVGRRLALAALRLVYRRDLVASGPVLASAAREGAAMRVRFQSVASGLDTSDGGPPQGFLIAGADRVWHRANARIEVDTVVVSSPEVPAPVAVRYGWANDPPNTLRNQADLPAAPFRTDDWPTLTASAVLP
jgi:sialate O-acetylesterase